MNRVTLRWMAFGGAVALAFGFVAPPARAQDNDDQKRAVARISVMDGEVSVRRGDSGDWVAGVINAPLMTDDRISTGPNSRAEVEFDSANVLRMGGTAEVRLTTLEAARYQMDLAHGTVTYRILRPSNINTEVDTPNISVRPSKVGAYRISVNDSGETELIVRLGDVEVFTPHGSQWVNAGQMMIARGNASDPEFQIVAANQPDEWDRWSDSRDRPMLHSVSVQNVPQGVYGAEDLDNNGTWVNNPDYGNVWRPTVPASWSPYGCGRWVWEDWYGWTWVGCEAWGWAPYHYGRWFWGANNGWLWYPGVLGVRHYWSPALVGFFGFGGGAGFGVGFGFGHIGWVPLAPYEVFHPWWGRGFYGAGGFNRSINVSNVNITNVYRNARVANGVNGVAAADFQSGRFNNMVRPSGEQMRSAGLIHGQTPMTPNAASMRYSDRQVGYTPRSNQNTQFFRQQQPNSVQHMGATARAQAPSQAARPGTAAPSAAGAGGWRRFGEPAAAATGAARPAPGNPGSSMQNTRPPQASGNGNGWQRFGEPGGANRAPAYNAPNGPASRPQNAPAARPGAPQYAQPAPRYNNNAPAPRYSAPAPSAPRPSGGGGGGGGSRPSAGGGGHSGGNGGAAKHR